jgi:hypothetical protein
VPASAASVAPVPVLPTTPVTTVATLPPIPAPTLPPPAYPTYRTYPTVPTTTIAPTTKSPTSTPAHAPPCLGEPTGTQILALIKGEDGVPDKPLRVVKGPFCSGDWSFTTVELDGKSEDELEPLMVLTTGKGAALTLIAGSDVCSNRVQTDAPPGIRVLACGF